MNKSFQVVVLTILLLITVTPGTQAQVNLSKWQIGINGGIFVYQGDLSPWDAGSYKTVKPVFGAYISRILNPSFLLRTNVAVGKLHGNEGYYKTPAWRPIRSYSFTTPVAEISELLVWNMYGNNGNELGQRFSPYMFAGAGVSFLKITRDYSKSNFANATNNSFIEDINHTPPRATLVIPVGLGMEFYLTPKLSLTAETNVRYAFTDYLDGYSLSANPERNDSYHSHTIGLLYRFGKGNQLGCPVMKR